MNRKDMDEGYSFSTGITRKNIKKRKIIFCGDDPYICFNVDYESNYDL